MAEQALSLIQSLDPPGVAARDLRECLLNQLSPDLLFYEEMKALITNHLEDLRDNPYVELPTEVKSPSGFAHTKRVAARER